MIPKAAPAVSGLLGFDTDTRVSRSAAQQFYLQGFHFCLRYVSYENSSNDTDLNQDQHGQAAGASAQRRPTQSYRQSVEEGGASTARDGVLSALAAESL